MRTRCGGRSYPGNLPAGPAGSAELFRPPQGSDLAAVHRPAGGRRPAVHRCRRESGCRRRCGFRTPLVWGAVIGVVQAASPLAFPPLPPATVYALGLVFIAAVYIGFAVADGRRHVLAVEVAVASVFVLVAAAAVPGSVWWIVAGLAGHGLKDLWQHRTGFVTGTRWWPPFCAAVDWVCAALVAVALTVGSTSPW